jgi:hemolysin-activating ACP:hemolysin acyltransferase
VNKASVQQLNDPDKALGLAAAYVAAHSPFGSYRADRLVGSIAGQIRRRHYVFAVRDKVIVGYVGWALCEPHIAKKWIEEGRVPSSEQYDQGNVVVPIIVISEDPSALRQLAATMRKTYEGRIYMARRVKMGVETVRCGVI